jgi:hypothetical protein
MGIIDRGRGLTNPTTVERASRRERWKRQAWMILSFWLSAAPFVIGLYTLVQYTTLLPASAPESWAVTALIAFCALALDIFVVFPWGFKRFDLVAPWQFREVKR